MRRIGGDTQGACGDRIHLSMHNMNMIRRIRNMMGTIAKLKCLPLLLPLLLLLVHSDGWSIPHPFHSGKKHDYDFVVI